MENYRLTQTGEEVQGILNGAAMQQDLTAENERAQGAEQTLQGNIDEEERRAKAAEETLSGAIGDEELRAKAAEEALGDAIDGINAKIPAAASSENKLADQDFVNSSIETATATFRGTYNLVSDLHLAVDATHAQIATLLGTVIAEADNNDYSYVLVPTSAQTPTEIASIEKYTFGANGWAFAYALNNSGFTSAQWAAINSGITSGLVAKLNALPTNTDLLLLLAGKQDVLTFDDIPVEGSTNPVKSGGVHSAIDDEKTARVNAMNALSGRVDTIEGEIPAQASSENQLADKNYVNSSISTATATFRGAFNLISDLGLTVSATHEQIGTALAGEISTADNNDYAFVQVPTSDETPAQILKVERYKFNGTAWVFEYELNNSGFTAAQWAALNSGITSGLVAKLVALPTNDELVLALAGKQDTLTFDNTPTENSNNPVKSSGVYAADKALSDAIEAILLLIPSAATSLNKLVDTDLMNSSISTATATFRGTFNLVSDLSLDLTATHAQIATALAGEIATADNNDYAFVQVPTAVGTPTEIASTDRYKFNGSSWAYEYTLNTSGFTSAQWAAINSGITAALVASLADIPDLIPSEATSANQLADKAYVLASILAATPAFKGQFTTLAELQAVASPKDGDLGIVRTKDGDGMDVFTVYQYLSSAWGVFYSLSYHPQTKPATTGTTGDYPYNGMGRVELAKNMVNTGTELAPVYENQLTQDMFYKGAVGSRVPNTNTIFVIQYDYILAENITIPDGCVLEFEGGSISGSYTLTGVNTSLINPKAGIFNGVNIAGTWNVPYISSDFFADAHQVNRLQNAFKLLNANIQNTIVVEDGDYYEETFTTGYATPTIISNTHLILNGTIHLDSNNNNSYNILSVAQYAENVHISGSGGLEGDRATNTATGEWGHGLALADVVNVLIEGITISMCFGDGVNFYRHCENVEIRRCKLNYCRRIGIAFYTLNNVSIHDCYFEGCGRDYNNIAGVSPASAIEVEGDDVPARNSGPISIFNNNMYNNRIGVNIGGPYVLSGISVISNKINDTYCGISIGANNGTGDGGTYSEIIVEGNEITDIEERGIQINSDNAIIKGNTIKDKTAASMIGQAIIFIGNFSEISYNTIHAKQGIYCWKGTSGIGYNKVIHNKVESYGNPSPSYETSLVVPEGDNEEIAFNYVAGQVLISCNNSTIHDNTFVLINNNTYQFVEIDSTNIQVYNNLVKCTATNEATMAIASRGCTGKMWNNRFDRVIHKYFQYDNVFAAALEDEVTRGTTAERPSIGNYALKANYAGFEYYDTTLSKKIMWNGTGWVNVDGTAL